MNNQHKNLPGTDKSGKGIRRRDVLKAGAQLGLMTSALALPNVSMGQSTPPNILWISIAMI